MTKPDIYVIISVLTNIVVALDRVRKLARTLFRYFRTIFQLACQFKYLASVPTISIDIPK